MSIIKINVHPYVKRILIKEFGEEPIFAAQNNIIGIMIRPILTDKSDNKRHLRGAQDETLDILLPKRLKHLLHNKKESSVFFVYSEDLIKLKHSLKKFVDFLIVNNILCLKDRGTPTMQAFTDVYKRYDLSEDMISQEAMMNLYKRHKKALQINYHKKIKDDLNNKNIGGNN